jgi:hypothetical protein
MPRVTATVTLALERERCYEYLQASIREERFLRAYSALHPPLEYSGEVMALEAGRRIQIREAGIDTLTHLRMPGWEITFSLTRVGAAETAVEIAVAYGWLIGLLGFTTARGQAKNEILGWVRALLAFERGSAAGPPRTEW